MDLYYNQQKVSQLPLTGQNTIGQIKKILSDWLVPQGVTNYTVRLFFNNGTELSDIVFKTNTYDASNLEPQAALLPGGSVHVMPQVGLVNAPTAQTPTPVSDTTDNKPKEKKEKKTKQKKDKKEKDKKQKKGKRTFNEAKIFYLVKYNDEYKLFRTESDAYEWLVGEIVDSGVELDELGLDTPIDYEDEDVQNIVNEYIEEDGDNLVPESVDLLE